MGIWGTTLSFSCTLSAYLENFSAVTKPGSIWKDKLKTWKNLLTACQMLGTCLLIFRVSFLLGFQQFIRYFSHNFTCICGLKGRSIMSLSRKNGLKQRWLSLLGTNNSRISPVFSNWLKVIVQMESSYLPLRRMLS